MELYHRDIATRGADPYEEHEREQLREGVKTIGFLLLTHLAFLCAGIGIGWLIWRAWP